MKDKSNSVDEAACMNRWRSIAYNRSSSINVISNINKRLFIDYIMYKVLFLTKRNVPYCYVS